jgi:transposase-like protein
VAAKRKKKSTFEKKREKEAEERIQRRRSAIEKRQRCIDLFESGVTVVSRIADEVGVTRQTVGKWLRDAGLSSKKEPVQDSEDVFTEIQATDEFADRLESETDSILTDPYLKARDDEQQALLEVAQNQSSPADKYQAYVATSAIRMLRDNLPNVRGPRTIRELSELDQLIRRSLGLNPKGNSSGSAGTLTIDINVLNNTKADMSKNRTIDAQPYEEDDEDDE